MRDVGQHVAQRSGEHRVVELDSRQYAKLDHVVSRQHVKLDGRQHTKLDRLVDGQHAKLDRVVELWRAELRVQHHVLVFEQHAVAFVERWHERGEPGRCVAAGLDVLANGEGEPE
jgi:hypothetical protein